MGQSLEMPLSDALGLHRPCRYRTPALLNPQFDDASKSESQRKPKPAQLKTAHFGQCARSLIVGALNPHRAAISRSGAPIETRVELITESQSLGVFVDSGRRRSELHEVPGQDRTCPEKGLKSALLDEKEIEPAQKPRAIQRERGGGGGEGCGAGGPLQFRTESGTEETFFALVLKLQQVAARAGRAFLGLSRIHVDPQTEDRGLIPRLSPSRRQERA